MLWLLAVVVDIFLETAIALYLRRTAKQTTLSPIISTAITYVLGVLPIAVGYALLQREQISIPTPPATLWIACASICFVIANILIFRVYTKLDASLYTTINTSKYIVILVVASLIIGDKLTAQQMAGAVVILFSSAAISYIFGRSKQAKAPSHYIALAFFASFIVALAQLSERMALGLVSSTTYILLGWGLQALLLGAFAAKSILRLRPSKVQERPLVIIGLMRGIAGVCIVYALATTQNISLIAPLAAAKVVTIALASFVLLGERSHLAARIGAAVTALIGVLLIIA